MFRPAAWLAPYACSARLISAAKVFSAHWIDAGLALFAAEVVVALLPPTAALACVAWAISATSVLATDWSGVPVPAEAALVEVPPAAVVPPLPDPLVCNALTMSPIRLDSVDWIELPFWPLLACWLPSAS